MFNSINLEDFKDILSSEGQKFSENVRKNINSKGITKSGKTVASIHEETPDGKTLIVWGREDFQNIETGTSPQQAQTKNATKFRANIYEWSKYLPITFKNDKQRYFFAWRVTDKIYQFGTKLYREGGRKDIYTNEIQPLLDSISESTGRKIKELKLL